MLTFLPSLSYIYDISHGAGPGEIGKETGIMTTMKLAMGLLGLIEKRGAATVDRYVYPGFSAAVNIDRAILSHSAARGHEKVAGKGKKIAAECDMDNRRRYMASLNL